MSRGGSKKGSHGIGAEWLKKYLDDVFPKDFIVIRGKKMKVPKYYNRSYELTNEKEYACIRGNRIALARNNPNNDPDRLAAGEEIKKAQYASLPRTIEQN